MVPFQLYWQRKTSSATLCNISDTSFLAWKNPMSLAGFKPTVVRGKWFLVNEINRSKKTNDSNLNLNKITISITIATIFLPGKNQGDEHTVLNPHTKFHQVSRCTFWVIRGSHLSSIHIAFTMSVTIAMTLLVQSEFNKNYELSPYCPPSIY